MRHTITNIKMTGINWPTALAFSVFHLAPLGLLWTGITIADLIVCFVLYVTRGFFITGGYHRYFSHRGYSMGRSMQFIMALGGTCALQSGPLWWAAHHRHHHKASDKEDDIHSPITGFFWAHIGWMLSNKNKEAPLELVRDFSKYPEIRWLDRWHFIPPIVLGILCLLIGGISMLLVAFLSTVFTYHTTWAVNSVTHLFGTRRYATTDTSRNSWWVAFFTFGGGWHNNHHHFPTTAKAGFRWYEIDLTYYGLKILSYFRLVRNLKVPPRQALLRCQIKEGNTDIGMLSKKWRHATIKLERLIKKARRLRDEERVALEEFLGKVKLRWEELVNRRPTSEMLENMIWSVRIKYARVLRRLKYA